MRLLHTADWHLGRAFHGEELLGAQAAFVDFVVAAARSAQVDGVLIAGDLYDRALPPVDAVRLASEALARLAEVAPVVVISGNHDSAARLSFGAELFASADVHLRTHPLSASTPVPLADGWVYAVPYLEPDLVREPLGIEERTHAAAIDAAMARVREDAVRREGPLVVMAHAFVAGGMPSESERDLAVGGAANVPAFAFDGAHYVALGTCTVRRRSAAGSAATPARRSPSRSQRRDRRSRSPWWRSRRARCRWWSCCRRRSPGRSRTCAARSTSCSPTRDSPTPRRRGCRRR